MTEQELRAEICRIAGELEGEWLKKLCRIAQRAEAEKA